MKQYTTTSEKETKDLAKKLAKQLHGVIALSGELGAGKTTFVQGFAKGLGIKEKILSPTFVLIRQHYIPNSKQILYHLDLYRIDDPDQIESVGIKELLQNPKNMILIEWAEKIKKYLPKETTWIYFETLGNSKRKITV